MRLKISTSWLTTVKGDCKSLLHGNSPFMKPQVLEAILLSLSMCAFIMMTYVALPQDAPAWKIFGYQLGFGTFFSMFLVVVGKEVWEWVEEEW